MQNHVLCMCSDACKCTSVLTSYRLHKTQSCITFVQGIEVDCFGTTRQYFGILVAFLADTPAAGLVGGFKEGVGAASRGCRTCMIKSEDLCTKVR